MTTINIHNALTGEQITRDMNEAELAQHEIDKTNAKADAKAQADKATAKQAVLDKLGLTADEVTALLG